MTAINQRAIECLQCPVAKAMAKELEQLRAEVLHAYDRGHHDGALGVTTIPDEYASSAQQEEGDD